MIIKNNWIQTNVKSLSSQIDLEVTIKTNNLKDLSFESACSEVVSHIKDYNLFLGLSGGADSLFVAKCLIEHSVPFEALICCTPFNKIETEYAFDFCKKYNLKYRVFTLTKKEYAYQYRDRIAAPFKGVGDCQTATFHISDYIKKEEGTFVSGVTPIGGTHYNKVYLGFHEYSFYSDIVFGDSFEIPFFLYSQEVAYSLIKLFSSYKDSQKLKSDLYKFDYREKNFYIYDDSYSDLLTKVRCVHGVRIKKEIGKFVDTDLIANLMLENKTFILKEENICHQI